MALCKVENDTHRNKTRHTVTIGARTTGEPTHAPRTCCAPIVARASILLFVMSQVPSLWLVSRRVIIFGSRRRIDEPRCGWHENLESTTRRSYANNNASARCVDFVTQHVTGVGARFASDYCTKIIRITISVSLIPLATLVSGLLIGPQTIRNKESWPLSVGSKISIPYK